MGVNDSTLGQTAMYSFPRALLWNLGEGSPKGAVVHAILDDLGVVVYMPGPEHLGDTVGALVGIPGFASSSKPYRGTCPEGEFILLCDFSETMLDAFLAKSRQARAVVGYKAVLTEENRLWTLAELIDHVAREHAMMQAQMKTRRA